MVNLLKRFLRYVSIDTQSDPNSATVPSTNKQFELANILSSELQELELSDVQVDKNCFVTATLEANTNKDIQTVGFMAHIDTSPDFSGANVKPKIIENYNGKDIVLNVSENIVLSPEDFPQLLDYQQQTLIVTDGTTLLGADDKAGIAEIMTALEILHRNPDIKHGQIKIAFTPDEEIGRGAKYFDVNKFAADFAYTLDGGPVGELEYENFNAAVANIKISGRNVHPGSAKNQMINSQQVAMEFNALLPTEQRPEHTEKREGFFHLTTFRGDVENSVMQYIIRDHDKNKFEDKKLFLYKIVDFINTKYAKNLVTIEIRDQYYNMRQKIEPVIKIVEIAEKAMKNAGIEPLIKPIRGGTDGALLSYMGLPTPNIFAGGHNFHGKFEFIPLQSMQKAVEVILEIMKIMEKS